MSVTYDRRVGTDFLDLFVSDDERGEAGVASSLVTYARHARFPVDLQFRRDAASGRPHATLYVGLTAVLNLRASAKGLKLDVHPTHERSGAFDPGWRAPRTPADLANIWADVELYLDRIIPIAARSHGRKEGAVQAALTSHVSDRLVVIDREATPSFANDTEKSSFMRACERPILEALAAADFDFGGRPKRLGNECDALAVDTDGQLLAVEVKPLGVGKIAWVAAQAAMYARIMQSWAHEAGNEAAAVVQGLLDQRVHVGLASNAFAPVSPLRVVPVVALQRGASPELVRRMLAVRDVLAAADLGLPPVEIFEVTLLGEMLPLDESRHADGRPRARVSYVIAENRRQIQWKRGALPEDAQAAGQVHSRRGALVGVGHVLPADHAHLNLLEDVREPAIKLFAKLGIPWHQGVAGGPSPNLRSSQVQCVNALGRMVRDPDRILRAFGAHLDIAEVRDFGDVDPTEAGRFLTFEYIGPADHDYFTEGKGGIRVRGSQCTSVDAAFAYTTSTGVHELALVEWKYTECYPSVASGSEARLPERTRRYERALLHPDSPLRIEGIPIGDLFHEPLYQLVRQQLLARELESDDTVDAQIVRVVHVLSPANLAYTRSYVAPSLRGRGDTVGTVWRSLLRQPDRFVTLDPQVFSGSFGHQLDLL